jgi:hypothetical protein
MSDDSITDAGPEAADTPDTDPATAAGNEASSSAGDQPGTDAVQVNSQILDAVRQTRSAVRIDSGDTSKVVDAGVGYQKASQAAALAVQDATDYLRNVMTIASTAEGMALKLMLETKDPFYSTVLTEAQSAVSAAAANLEVVGKSATAVATSFPR